MEILEILVAAVWFILPAYVANATPVVLGGGKPIDGGKKFTDGRPIFGPGKTVRGFIAGIIAGSIVGALQAIFGRPGMVTAGFLLSLGALVGDLMGSFIKRRFGLPRGSSAPGLDQLGFLLIAMAFAAPVALPTPEMFVALLIITPILHISTNYCGYLLKLKDRPY
ncbi:MAG: CDP-2,3-bis-(O-geranylgeranyl)-sn-glycerol synthase [Candidatus Hadarchaeales archaeon]